MDEIETVAELIYQFDTEMQKLTGQGLAQINLTKDQYHQLRKELAPYLVYKGNDTEDRVFGVKVIIQEKA